jgi:microcompartment protein CcmL/EutN
MTTTGIWKCRYPPSGAAALEAGAQAVDERGTLIAAEVISRPHEDLLRLLPS